MSSVCVWRVNKGMDFKLLKVFNTIENEFQWNQADQQGSIQFEYNLYYMLIGRFYTSQQN